MNKLFLFLIALSILLRILAGTVLELGVDESYYTLYVKELQYYYFDHPPLFAWLAYISTLGYENIGEIWLRLPSILLGCANCIWVYVLAKYMFTKTAGITAATLYTATLYGSVISGIFLMPDATLSFFWLMAIYMCVRILENPKKIYFIGLGIAIAFGFLSKWQIAFIPIGLIVYALVHQRSLFANPYLYVSGVIAALGLMPMLIWNYQHNFESFVFHGERISTSTGINWEYVGSEIGGEMLYQNPIVFVLLVIGVIHMIRLVTSPRIKLLLYTSIPLILCVIILSFTSRTLPHWTGVAYANLIIVSSYYLSKHTFTYWRLAALILSIVILFYGILEIQYGWIMNSKSQQQESYKKGKHDFTQDMYGWQQLSEKISHSNAQKIPTIISHRWFPAGHLDYYVAQPLHKQLTVLHPEKKFTHQYVHHQHPIYSGDSLMFITSSHQFFDPFPLYEKEFTITPIDTIEITRRNDTIRFHYLYLLQKK